MKYITLLATMILLNGCVLKWGQSFNIAMSNSRSVVVEYDPALLNLPSMLKAVQNECSKFGKDAVFSKKSRGNLGIIVNTYRCEKRKTDMTIDITHN